MHFHVKILNIIVYTCWIANVMLDNLTGENILI